MYYPYFRGKQYELITIRETSSLLTAQNFVPIIEPVKKQINGLQKTLDVLCENTTKAITIVNPQKGDHSDDGAIISRLLLSDAYADASNLIIGILLTEKMTSQEAVELCHLFNGRNIALIHAGFSEAKQLAVLTHDFNNIVANIFIENFCGKLYQKYFTALKHSILIRDGFERRTNREHPDASEFYSDLHATFELENMQGFGDYLIVGDGYTEGGGPAYTIAIHLTYIDPTKDDEMHIRHFKSDRQDTPQDPAGKFAEALKKLIVALDSDNNYIRETSAVKEFRDLHHRGHYPGLGYVKKLSMKHHIETLAIYFQELESDG